MDEHHTWMAGVTKISIVYPTRFWKSDTREQINTTMGLPTQLGPAFQVYDASTADGKVAAMTFFALVDSNTQAATDDGVLAKLVLDQLSQLWTYFGHDEDIVKQLTSSYIGIHVKRWPDERYISEESKPTQVHLRS
jgi:monoamine oxidase